MKYTKGKWAFEETTEGLEIWSGDTPIATIHSRNLMDGDALDNGLLISKAPAMYGALKRLKENAEGALDASGESWLDPKIITKGVLDIVNSALEGL